MDLRRVSINVLQFLVIIFPQVSAVTHTLQYLYTALTPGIKFTVVGQVDGEEFVYYDSIIMRAIPKTDWILKINTNDPDYWNGEMWRMRSDQEDLHHLFLIVMKEFNHTEGAHALQWMYGCEIYNNGTTRGYDQYKYDGEDFISLDLNTETWMAANDKAVIVKHKWEEIGAGAKHWKFYLENECIDWLKKFVCYSRETLERKGGSGTPIGIIIVEVACLVALIALFAGNVAWKRN